MPLQNVFRRKWLRYVAIPLLVLAAAAMRVWPLQALELRNPYLTFYPAVLLAALYGGGTGGLLATTLSAITILSWSPTGQPFIKDAGDWQGMAVFLVNGTLMSLIGEALLRAKEHARTAQVQAETDFLTGCTNRRHFMELANYEFARVRRYRQPMSVLMLDLDHFKSINDTHGHQAGDAVLKEFARVCHGIVREADVIGRVGGEEFAIMMPETDKAKAVEVAERLCRAVAAAEVTLAKGLSLHFTTSIGVANITPVDANVAQMLARADAALYEAKSTGRNQVRVSLLESDARAAAEVNSS